MRILQDTTNKDERLLRISVLCGVIMWIIIVYFIYTIGYFSNKCTITSGYRIR